MFKKHVAYPTRLEIIKEGFDWSRDLVARDLLVRPIKTLLRNYPIRNEIEMILSLNHFKNEGNLELKLATSKICITCHIFRYSYIILHRYF